MNSQDYLEIAIRLDPFDEQTAEILMADIAELPFDTFVTEPPFLKCYIQREDYQPQQLKAVLSGCPAAAGMEVALVQGRNWNRDWEERFQPIVVDGIVTIKAPFNEAVPRTRYNIWIDPQMAFGTGSHHTTFMMMQEMLRLPSVIRGGTVLDMGCGTAILGILAAKMGAAKVMAIDIDAVAARSAWGNARWNRVGTRIQTACGDASLLQMGSYDVLLANIHRNVILQDLPTYVRSLRKGGHLLLSGFFTEDAPAIQAAASGLGLRPDNQREREGWSCLSLCK